MYFRALAVAAALLPTASFAHAHCDTEKNACTLALADYTATEAVHEETGYQTGDILPVYDYNILINPEYYGLPPVDGYWRYYRVNGEIFRVHAATNEILEQVTTQSAMFR